MDIDKCLETLKNGRYLSEREVFWVCVKIQEILSEDSNVINIKAPVKISGNINGHFLDLLELFRQGGQIPEENYIFMGGFVNRGQNSVETIEYLLCLKLKYPDNITLLRGNHESRQITYIHGFYDEIVRKYGNANPWRYFTDVFDYLPLGALVDGKVLCVHGGLSPELRTIDQIRTIDRKTEIPHEGPFCDLMWSDPEEVDTWAQHPKSMGQSFGKKVAQDFNHINGLNLIARAHQLIQDGYRYWFEEQLVSIWSAPNYCSRCGNTAAILSLNQNLKRQFIVFKEDPESVQSIHQTFLLPFLF